MSILAKKLEPFRTQSQPKLDGLESIYGCINELAAILKDNNSSTI